MNTWKIIDLFAFWIEKIRGSAINMQKTSGNARSISLSKTSGSVDMPQIGSQPPVQIGAKFKQTHRYT